MSALRPTDPRHGTRSGYYGASCRCEACRSWQRFNQIDRRRANGVRPKAQQLADVKNAALAVHQAFLDDPTDPRHGTINGYNHHRCRCASCTEANRQYCLLLAQAARIRPTPDHVHGTINGYAYWGCRCDRCYTAQSDANRAGRARRKAAKQARA